MNKEKFFNQFDKVYCINLPHRDDRRENFIKEVEKYDLGDFSFFDAIYGVTLNGKYHLDLGNVGLIKTNIQILDKCIENNLNNVIIIEDDCYFTDEIKNIEKYLNQVPDDWDMIYFGGNHNIGHYGIKGLSHVSESVIRIRHTFTTHFVIIKNTMFNIIKNKISECANPIDVYYTDLQKNYNVYSIYPAIAKQKTGYSNILNQEVNYDSVIK